MFLLENWIINFNNILLVYWFYLAGNVVKGVTKQNYFSTISLTLQSSLISLYRAPLTLKFNEFFSI